MRAALIGCGAIGAEFDMATGSRPGVRRTHAGALFDHPEIDLVAVCDLDRRKRDATARAFSVTETFAGAADMLTSVRPDVVSIATPSDTHLECVETALEAGVRSIWLEKPLGRSRADAERIASMIDAAGARAVLNYPRRWSRTAARLKDVIKLEPFGAVVSARALYDKGLANNGGHMIDLLIHLLGEPCDVTAGAIVADDRTEDLTREAVLTFKDGHVPVRLDARDHRGLTVFELDLQFERGRAQLTERGAKLMLCSGIPSDFGYRLPQACEILEHGLDGVFEAALDELRSLTMIPSRSATCGPTDGAAVWGVVETIRRQSFGR